DFAGVQIVAAPRPQRMSPLAIHGAYRIPWADADALAPSRHRAIVLVATAGDRYVVATPFRGRILFEDDELSSQIRPTGFFSIDVFEIQGSDAPGDYHLLVSLGPYTSNVVRVAVG